MWKRLTEKYLCLHSWKSWASNTDYRSTITTEMVVCEKCGKIKRLEY